MKIRLLSICAIGVVLTVSACGGGGSDKGIGGGGQLVDGRTLTMSESADPGTLDPHLTSAGTAYEIDRFLYDTLVHLDAKGKEESGLATKWSSTTTTATFTLRPNVTCSDGSPLTAKDVADNISWVGDPKNESSRLGVFVPPGAKAVARGKDVVSVSVPAPASFLARTIGNLPIVCASGMRDRSRLTKGAAGTGMFTVKEAKTDDQYVLIRRKDYAWGPGDWKQKQKGLPDQVRITIVPNESTAANLMLSGDLNLATMVGPDKDRLAAQKYLTRTAEQPNGELWFNQKPGLPGSDVAVRTALVQALDLKKLAAVTSGGSFEPPTSLVPAGQSPCTINSVKGTLPGHDVAKAKDTLESAGWSEGPDGVREKDGRKLAMTFYYSTSLGASGTAGAELLQDAWKAVGADVKLRNVTDAEASGVIIGGQGSWDATIVPLNVFLPSMIVPFASGPTPPNGTNFSFIDNADYNAGVAKASAKAGTDGCEDWAAAESALFKHSDLIPFYNGVNPTFARGATFQLSGGAIDATSIRMIK